MERVVPNVDKMYTYLRGYCVGAKMEQSIKALQFAREKHKDQMRKDGLPYIAHPLSLACYAVALGLRDDDIIATLLLHDVCEDCGVTVDNLPSNEKVKRGVKYMTVTKLDISEDKITTKKRYYKELLESKEALLCKGFDRYHNLTDMPFALTNDSIGKNAAETELFLLPVLKEAKEKWADLSDILFVLRTNIKSINDILRLKYKEDYIKWYKYYKEG